METLFHRRSDKIEEQMMALPCTCAADFAAKMIVDTYRGTLFADWQAGDIWKEARALIGEAQPAQATVPADQPKDRHAEWLREWKDVRQNWLAEGKGKDLALHGPLVDEMTRLQNLACETEATTVEGILAQTDFAFALMGDGFNMGEMPLLSTIRAGIAGLAS